MVTITLKLELPDDVDLSWDQAFSQAGAIYSSLHPEHLNSSGHREIVWEG